jgi:hypothetical protein
MHAQYEAESNKLNIKLLYTATKFGNWVRFMSLSIVAHSLHCFATDRSKAVTPRILTFVVCFETYNCITMLSSPFYFLTLVGRLCLLDVAVPDMHILLFHTTSSFRECPVSELSFRGSI